MPRFVTETLSGLQNSLPFLVVVELQTLRIMANKKGQIPKLLPLESEQFNKLLKIKECAGWERFKVWKIPFKRENPRRLARWPQGTLFPDLLTETTHLFGLPDKCMQSAWPFPCPNQQVKLNSAFKQPDLLVYTVQEKVHFFANLTSSCERNGFLAPLSVTLFCLCAFLGAWLCLKYLFSFHNLETSRKSSLTPESDVPAPFWAPKAPCLHTLHCIID